MSNVCSFQEWELEAPHVAEAEWEADWAEAVGHGPSPGGLARSPQDRSGPAPALRLLEPQAGAPSTRARIYGLRVADAGQRRGSRARPGALARAKLPSWAPALAAGLVVAGLLVMLALPLRALGG